MGDFHLYKQVERHVYGGLGQSMEDQKRKLVNKVNRSFARNPQEKLSIERDE